MTLAPRVRMSGSEDGLTAGVNITIILIRSIKFYKQRQKVT